MESALGPGERIPGPQNDKDTAMEFEMIEVIKFRNSVRSVVTLALLISMFLSIGFGVINFLKLFLVFFNPFGIALAYTVSIGISAIGFAILLHILYAIQWIGAPGEIYSESHKKTLVCSIVDYFEPGCLYDCRVIENRRDVISLMVGVVLSYIASVIIYWLAASHTSTPATDTPEGVVYIQSQIALMMLAILQIYSILSGLWGYYRVAILTPETISPRKEEN